MGLEPDFDRERIEETPAPDESEESDEPEGPTVIVPEVPPLRNVVRVESAASPEVCLTPIDVFAPPRPTGLVAVASGGDVLLTWTEIDRPDVTGYRVYRSDRRRGPVSLLNEEPVRAPSYTDETVTVGENYFYFVTALDDAPAVNESEPSETREVRIAPP